jgi:hypothetical protein
VRALLDSKRLRVHGLPLLPRPHGHGHLPAKGSFGSPESLRDPGLFPGPPARVERKARARTLCHLEAYAAGRPNPIHLFSSGRPLPTSRLLAPPPRRFPESPHVPSPCFPSCHRRSTTPLSRSLLHITAAPRRRPGDATRRDASLSAPPRPYVARSTTSSPLLLVAPPRRCPSSFLSSRRCHCICSSSPIYIMFVFADNQAWPILVSFPLPLSFFFPIRSWSISCKIQLFRLAWRNGEFGFGTCVVLVPRLLADCDVYATKS